MMVKGRLIWNPDARSVYFGLSMSTNRAQMIRGMEGAAFALLDNLEEAEKIGLCPKQFFVLGVAPTVIYGLKSRLLLSIVKLSFPVIRWGHQAGWHA